MESSPSERYKRPFLVQLTPAESDLLDRVGSRLGTKRKAVVEGLRLLGSGELEALRTRIAELEQAAEVAASEVRTVVATRVAEVDGVRRELNHATTHLREERATLRSVRAELRGLRRELASAREQLTGAQQVTRRFASLVPHHVFCATCAKLVPETEWAEQPDQKGGVYVYHRPDGFRPKATLTQRPSVLFWLPAPRETGR